MQDARWLFFDLGNTLISEERAWERRIQRLVSSLERYGRRRAIEEVRAALREASVRVELVTAEEAPGRWGTLDGADAIIMGAPTYMGSLSAPFKAFMDATGSALMVGQGDC